MKSHIVMPIKDINGDIIISIPDELTKCDYPWLLDDEILIELRDDSSLIVTNKSWLQRNEDGFG